MRRALDFRASPRNEVHLIASAGVSLEAAAAEARRRGIEAVILSDSIEGEAREVGGVHAAIAREVATRDRPFRKPVLILSGGETTVTLRAKGKGGRNSEFLLAFASASAASQASMRSPPTPTASTVRKTMPAPLPMVRRFRGCGRAASTPRRCSQATTPGQHSMRSAICSYRGRRARMSMICGPYSFGRASRSALSTSVSAAPHPPAGTFSP